MQALQWTNDDFVFVPEIDGDHQKLIRDAEKVRQVLANGAHPGQITYPVWRLAKTFATHLVAEERAMRRSQYAALQWHQQQHQAGRNKMARLMEAAHRKDVAAVNRELDEFVHWMKDHVGLADRMFAAHLRNDQRERLIS